MSDLIKLENSIKRGVISPIYLIYGEQDYLKEVAVNKLKQFILKEGNGDFNFDVFTEQINYYKIVESAEQLPVFADKRLVLVKSQNVFETKEGEEGLLNYLSQPNPSTCLAFVTDKVDMRKKVVKKIKESGSIIQVASPKGEQLVHWIEKQAKLNGKNIETAAVQLLITAVGDNLLLLEQEMVKCSLFTNSNTISLADMEKTISKSVSLSVFKITDLVAEKKAMEAVNLFKELLIIGEAPHKILALLGRTMRQLLKVKLLKTRLNYDYNDISRELKLPYFVGKKLIHQQQAFKQEKLEEAIEIIANTDWKIKTGQLDPVVAVEMTIYKLTN